MSRAVVPYQRMPTIAKAAPIAKAASRRAPFTREQVFFVAVLALFMMAILGPTMSIKDVSSTGEGSPLRQAGYLLIFATVAATAAWRDIRRLWAVSLNVMLVLGWCWLSISWSDVPATATRRLVLTSLLIWTTFVAVRELGYERTMTALRTVMVAILVANFAAVLLVPAIGTHMTMALDGDPALVGAWRGVMLQKNFAGAMCGFTILAFIFDNGRLSGKLRIAVIAVSLLFLWGTKSKTSAGLLLISLAAGWAFMRYNPRYRGLLLPAAMVATVSAALLGVIFWSDIVAPLYQPAAFTGRTQIWPPLLAYARDHPFGAGYGSFWNIGPGASPIFLYAKGWVSHLGNGHNGYIDLMVQIGGVGLLLVIGALILWPIGRLLASLTVSRGEGALLIGLILFVAGHNMTESTILDRDMLGQVVLMFALAMTAVVTTPPSRQTIPAGNGRRPA